MCRRKISFFRRRRKTEKEKELIFRKGINISYSMDEKQSGEGKGKKWRRNLFFAEEKKNGKGKGGNYLEKENVFCGGEEKTEKEKKKNI